MRFPCLQQTTTLSKANIDVSLRELHTAAVCSASLSTSSPPGAPVCNSSSSWVTPKGASSHDTSALCCSLLAYRYLITWSWWWASAASSRVDSHERLEDNEKAIPLLLFLSATTFAGPVHSGVHQQHCSLISQGSTVTVAQLKPSIVDFFWLALPFRKWSVNNKDNSFILSLGVVALPCKEAKKKEKEKEDKEPSFSARRRALGLCARLWSKAVGVFAHLLPPTGTMVY